MKTYSISPTMANEIDGILNHVQPKTTFEAIKLVCGFLSSQSVHPYKLSVCFRNVYYYGYYQGIVIYLKDVRHQTKRQINPKGKVYCTKENSE